MKFALPFAALLALALCACNTVENRRSVYRTTKVEGPYTRSLEEGTWDEPKTVDQQYDEAKKKRRQQTPAAPAPAYGPAS